MKKRILLSSIVALLAGGATAGNDAAQYFNDLRLAQGYKSQANHNPLFTQRFGADPCAMVYGDEVYIYMTNDVLERKNGALIENTYSQINTINCVSSKDMVNWTDHGTMAVAKTGPARWASCSWAPTACHKTINGKEKFFLYFANNGSGIGVVTSDCPWGPWTDPIGRELISRQTPNCGNVTWLFDPAVLVDDDGTGYIYFGGGVPTGQNANPGTARVAKLGNDFTSISGQAETINPPYLFEDAGINKIGNKYIYSYCTNWSTGGNPYGFANAEIGYMTSNSPMGPFSYTGIAFANQGAFLSGQNGGNNHHSMFKFKGKWYMTYHARTLQNAMNICPGQNLNYRSTHVDFVNVDEASGKITKSKGSEKGVPQVESLNPFERTEAETMAWMGGIETVYGGSNMLVTNIQKGDWIGVAGVDFGAGASVFTARISSKAPGAIKICKGTPSGDVIGYISVPNTNGTLQEISEKLDVPVAGQTDLFFVFSGSFDFDYWQFKKSDVLLSASESLVSAPASIDLSVKTTEAGITKADFYMNETLIGSANAAPFAISYEIAEPGTYSFQAVLTNNQGKAIESNIEKVVAKGAFEGVAQTLPGQLEVERYDVGGEGISYHDEDDKYESEATTFRNDTGVDLDVTEDGGYVLGWTKKGEWLTYTVDILYDDTYTWTAKVASGLDGSAFSLQIDGKAIADVIEVPNTESWTQYTTVTGKTPMLAAGKHTLKLNIESDYCNIDYIQFKADNNDLPTTEVEDINAASADFEIYSMQGFQLGNIRSTVSSIASDLKDNGFAKGAYIVKSADDASTIVIVK